VLNNLILNQTPLIAALNNQEKKMSSAVSRPEAATSVLAVDYYSSLLQFETDCWDVHHASTNNRKDFVLLDVRSEALFDAGHIPGAICHPHPKLKEPALEDYPSDTLFVVYCAGPHCNGADKAALKLAQLGRPVKKMIGGVTGWLDEGFSLSNEATN